jgi:hypothetical protein
MKSDRGPADMNVPDDGVDLPIAATPEYLAMLSQVSGHVPTDDVDWDEFHTRLNARAELALVRLRTSNARNHVAHSRRRAQRPAPSWWEYVALPSHVWRPIAAAAAIAVAASVHALSSDGLQVESIEVASLAGSDITGARGAFESAVTGGTSSGTITSYLVPSSDETARSASSDSSTGK